MRENGYKGLMIAAAHVLIAAGILLGYETSISLVKSSVDVFKSNATTFTSLIADGLGFIRKTDAMVLYGVFAVLLLVGYDIKIFFGWASGFSFSTKRQCKHCKIRTARAERVFLDRVLSIVYPVKRFICLGCGRQYLMANPKHHKVEVPAEAESAFAAAPGADPRKVRNRFR